MVGVVMRDDDGIDRFGVDAGSREIGVELAGRTFALSEIGFARSRIDDDELGTGVYDDRAIRNRQLVLVHESSCQGGIDLVLLDVGDKRVRQRKSIDPVGNDRDLVLTHLVAVPARRLFAGSGSGGSGGSNRGERAQCSRGCGARKDDAAAQFGHGILPCVVVSLLRDLDHLWRSLARPGSNENGGTEGSCRADAGTHTAGSFGYGCYFRTGRVWLQAWEVLTFRRTHRQPIRERSQTRRERPTRSAARPLHCHHFPERRAPVPGATDVHQDGAAAIRRRASGLVGRDRVFPGHAAGGLRLCPPAHSIRTRPYLGRYSFGSDGRRLLYPATLDRLRLGPPAAGRRGTLADWPFRGVHWPAVLCALSQQSAVAGLVRAHGSSGGTRPIFPVCRK